MPVKAKANEDKTKPMKPINFKEVNTVYGANQEQYQPLPAYVSHLDGLTIVAFKLNWLERIRLLFTGRLWHCMYTYGKPLQPVWPTVQKGEAFSLVAEQFECQACGDVLPNSYCLRTPGTCYLCYPAITAGELLAWDGTDKENRHYAG